MDLSNLPLAELHALEQKITLELKSRELADRTAARKQIIAIAEGVGISLQDLLDVAPRVTKAVKKVAAQYRNPSDASQEWTGRGRQPKWVRERQDAKCGLDGCRF